jgi:predicted transcriptional regulator of viral defense system
MSKKEAGLLEFLKKRGGLASYSELSKAGFNKAVLRAGLESNRISRIDRGLYRLSEGGSVSHPDLVAVSIKIPRGVICLLSSLAFFEATNEIPKYVDVAIPRGTHANRINYPPVKFYRFDPKVWEAGIENREIDGRKIKVYNLAKTVADCFKFRNKIGIDIARKALKVAVVEKNIKPGEIMRYAKICRVDSLIKPLLETML